MAEVSAGRKRWAAPAAMLVLICCAGAQAQPNAPELYGKWWTTCDNTNACAVYGSGGGEGVAVTVMIRRGPEAQAPVRVSLVADGPRVSAAGGAWRVLIDGAPAAQARPRGGKVIQAELSPTDAATLVARLQTGHDLRLEGPSVAGSLALGGAMAALRKMDDEQGRAGGVTALADRGPKPAGAVPQPPAMPVIDIAALPPQTDLPNGVPIGHLDRRSCKLGKETPGEAATYRLGRDAVLWLAPCGGSERGQVLVLLSNAKGGKVRAALGGRGVGERVEAHFDPRTQILTAYESEHGMTDCGKGADYVWNGEAFEVVRESEMSECVGLPRELWPDSFRAVVRRAL